MMLTVTDGGRTRNSMPAGHASPTNRAAESTGKHPPSSQVASRHVARPIKRSPNGKTRTHQGLRRPTRTSLGSKTSLVFLRNIRSTAAPHFH